MSKVQRRSLSKSLLRIAGAGLTGIGLIGICVAVGFVLYTVFLMPSGFSISHTGDINITERGSMGGVITGLVYLVVSLILSGIGLLFVIQSDKNS